MLPSSTGGGGAGDLSDDSGSEEEERRPLNLHINQHSNLYKYNNQFTVAKRSHKKQAIQKHLQGMTSDGDDEGEDNDRPDSPIQVA